MFTGIIEQIGKIAHITLDKEQIVLRVNSDLSSELKVDQSLAHNGICLTVTSIENDEYEVCAVKETMDKTTIGNWQVGETVNLERGIKVGDRLDGHIVQGHVDAVGKCMNIKTDNENRVYTFMFDRSYAPLIVEKGSVVINGVSLTCYNVTDTSFEVTIIPYTFENTTFNSIQQMDAVNLEFDILGKYFQRHLSLK